VEERRKKDNASPGEQENKDKGRHEKLEFFNIEMSSTVPKGGGAVKAD